MEFKILASNLSPGVRRRYLKLVHTTEWNMTTYSKTRLGQRGLTFTKVLEALYEGELIEYHNVNGRDRILIRNTDGICVVGEIGLQYQGKIITTYRNNLNDNHSTLDKKQYLFA